MDLSMENKCHIMDVFPYFKATDEGEYRELDNLGRQQLKSKLVFMTELSRFLNKKAPMLLQVSNKILYFV